MYRLKQKALHTGKYPPPYTSHKYDKRDKSKAFRSISYNETVRQINALAEVIRFIEQNDKDKTRHE